MRANKVSRRIVWLLAAAAFGAAAIFGASSAAADDAGSDVVKIPSESDASTDSTSWD